MIKDELLQIGLSGNEIKTYLASLELGETTIARLAQKSGVKRTTTYLAVESLIKKGFLHILKKKKKVYFYAEDPRLLQEKALERKHAIDRIVPQLLSITNLIDKKPKITFYEGVEGLKDVLRDTLRYPDKEMLAWVSEEAFSALDQEFINYYVPERVNKKIFVRAIAPDTPEIRAYKEIEEKSLRKTKIANNDLFPIKVEIDLYGTNKIGIMAWEEKIGLIIESDKIYTTLRSIFEMNWDSL